MPSEQAKTTMEVAGYTLPYNDVKNWSARGCEGNREICDGSEISPFSGDTVKVLRGYVPSAAYV